jgi:hypothetical protein
MEEAYEGTDLAVNSTLRFTSSKAGLGGEYGWLRPYGLGHDEMIEISSWASRQVILIHLRLNRHRYGVCWGYLFCIEIFVRYQTGNCHSLGGEAGFDVLQKRLFGESSGCSNLNVQLALLSRHF